MATQFPQHLRYSPVNWLIVDWGFNGAAFNDCGLPSPPACPTAPESDEPDCCTPLAVQEAIDTYDWERWLPEVMVGIDDPDPEIAANYVRGAAIAFCKRARVLQRQVAVRLQPGQCLYPVEPYDGEKVEGVIGVSVDGQRPCPCSDACSTMLPNGINFTFDAARRQIRLEDFASQQCSCLGGVLHVLVWATPTENACAHDVFLYDEWRHEIAQEARRNYILAVHFRDKDLLRVLPPEGEFERNIRLAKGRSMQHHSWSQTRIGSGMWSPQQRYIAS